ncbi:MAG: SMC-Scp complex subunit ScpB [Thermoplasmatota archaeon]
MGVKEERLVECVLFSASNPVGVEEIKQATGLSKKKIEEAIDHLITRYNIEHEKETSIEVVKAGNKFAMQVKKKFFDQSVMIAKPEIQNHHLKTLALIAFHQPIKQSDLRRMAGPKIYDHVDELSSMKLIHAKKHGSTEMLTTTNFFPEYFGIESTEPNKIREYLAKKVIKPQSK